MKKSILIALSAAVVLTSCNSYNTATGAYAGGQFGHVIGSAVGGITGGWRGSQWGSLIGTVGGIAAGAAIGSSIDKKQTAERHKKVQRQQEVYQQPEDSGFDPMGRGDDRIVFQGNDYVAPALQIRHAGIYESVKDGVLTRGEECKVVFEIFNNSNDVIFDVRPLVEDVTANRHVSISPNLQIESIAPHKGIRYTATILADSRLKDGEILVRVGVAQGQNEITSETRQFNVPTAKAAR